MKKKQFGIPIGAELTFTPTDYKVKVASDDQIEYGIIFNTCFFQRILFDVRTKLEQLIRRGGPTCHLHPGRMIIHRANDYS